MAIVTSHVWSTARGRVAGIVYLTTPSGSIIARQYVIPVNAPSPFRTYIKDALIEAVSDWDTLTVAEKALWNAWAAANGSLSGRQEFIAGQALRNYVLNSGVAGVVVITQNLVVPQFNGHPAVTHAPTLFVAPASTGIAVKNHNTSPQAVICLLEVSSGLSNGRYYWKGPWDNTKTFAFVIAAGATITTAFAGLTLGHRYFVRMRAFTQDAAIGKQGTVINSAAITYSDAITNP